MRFVVDSCARRVESRSSGFCQAMRRQSGVAQREGSRYCSRRVTLCFVPHPRHLCTLLTHFRSSLRSPRRLSYSSRSSGSSSGRRVRALHDSPHESVGEALPHCRQHLNWRRGIKRGAGARRVKQIKIHAETETRAALTARIFAPRRRVRTSTTRALICWTRPDYMMRRVENHKRVLVRVRKQARQAPVALESQLKVEWASASTASLTG